MNQPCQFLDFFDGHDIWYQSQFSVSNKKKYVIMDVCLSLPLIKVILTKFICRHFLGAAGVFFAFLCIFTLDEDVRNQRRDSIRVFWRVKEISKHPKINKHQVQVFCIQEGTQSESFEGWKKSCDKDFLDTCPQPEEGLHMSLWRMNTILKHHKINKDQIQVFFIQRRDSIRVF